MHAVRVWEVLEGLCPLALYQLVCHHLVNPFKSITLQQQLGQALQLLEETV